MEIVDTELASIMNQDGGTLSVAESCSGGQLAAYLTAIPGCSEWFAGGVVSYSNRMKEQLLGVCAETLTSVGAVSESVARQMAEGVRRVCATSYGIGVTGIAGPSGGTADKPVGTVYIAWAMDAGTEVQRFNFKGDRSNVRAETVKEAVSGIKKRLTLPKKG